MRNLHIMDNKDSNKKAHNVNMENKNSDKLKNDSSVKKGSGANISTYQMMDDNNKKAADVLVSKGMDAAVEFMFKHPKTGQKMDYATMRYYYG